MDGVQYTDLVDVFEEALLLLVIQGVSMRHIMQSLLGLQGWKHNVILCLQSNILLL